MSDKWGRNIEQVWKKGRNQYWKSRPFKYGSNFSFWDRSGSRSCCMNFINLVTVRLPRTGTSLVLVLASHFRTVWGRIYKELKEWNWKSLWSWKMLQICPDSDPLHQKKMWQHQVGIKMSLAYTGKTFLIRKNRGKMGFGQNLHPENHPLPPIYPDGHILKSFFKRAQEVCLYAR